MKWNNGITVSMYNVYKISIEFFLSKSGIDFYMPPPHPSPSTFIALATLSKLQENYFSTVSQYFSYLTATAVTYQMLLFKMSMAGNIIACVLQQLKNIILVFCEFNSFLLFCFTTLLMSSSLSNKLT